MPNNLKIDIQPYKVNLLAPMDVFGITKFCVDFVLLTDFDENIMPIYNIQLYKIELKPWFKLWREFVQHLTVDGIDYTI